MTVAAQEANKVVVADKVKEPKFRDPATLTEEQLTDPDYAQKQIIRLFGNGKNEELLLCSKCHHCR